MTKNFDSFGALAAHLLTAGPAMALALHEGLDTIGKRLVRDMEGRPGRYQPGVGPFPAWAPLSPATEERKAAKGQPSDSPLVAEGDLKGSFSHQAQGLELVAGSKDPKMVFHEFGTAKMPPRPVVGPAGFENRDIIAKLVGAAAIAGMVGADEARGLLGQEIHESLDGYRFRTR